jgi:L-alanine-DL-glutamate epimerase-like enolase superfamily enzyme
MQVTGVETIPVEVPVKRHGEPYGIAPYVGGNRLRELPDSLSFEEALEANEEATESGKKLLVRLETDEGVTGWGEVKVPTMRTGQTLIEELVEPEVVGRSVWEMEGLVDTFASFSTMYYTDVTSYVGAVEMAMWDALGKHLGKPVHQLVGGKTRDTVPVAFCLGLLTPEESREYARFALEEGFSVLKTKGSRYWRTDVERIEAMHDEVDGRLEFRLDPNQLWQFEDAVRVGAMLEDAGIYLQYMEQPIRVDSFGTLKRLRQRLKTPIAVNEDAYFQRNLSMAASQDAVDAAVVDLVPAHGILGLKRLAGVASDFGISLAHHSNFDLGIKNAAKLHTIATTPAVNLPIDTVYYAYEDYILENPLEIEDGRFVVPDEPGLAAVDESKVEQYRLD